MLSLYLDLNYIQINNFVSSGGGGGILKLKNGQRDIFMARLISFTVQLHFYSFISLVAKRFNSQFNSQKKCVNLYLNLHTFLSLNLYSFSRYNCVTIRNLAEENEAKVGEKGEPMF